MLGEALSINRSLRNVNLNSLFHFLFPFEVCLLSHLFHGKQDNMIGSRGAEALGNALKVNSCLQALHLESLICVHAVFHIFLLKYLGDLQEMGLTIKGSLQYVKELKKQKVFVHSA